MNHICLQVGSNVTLTFTPPGKESFLFHNKWCLLPLSWFFNDNHRPNTSPGLVTLPSPKVNANEKPFTAPARRWLTCYFGRPQNKAYSHIHEGVSLHLSHIYERCDRL